MTFQNAADNIFTWIIIIAIVAVVVSSGARADRFISTIGEFLAAATRIIVSPGARQ